MFTTLVAQLCSTTANVLGSLFKLTKFTDPGKQSYSPTSQSYLGLDIILFKTQNEDLL